MCSLCIICENIFNGFKATSLAEHASQRLVTARSDFSKELNEKEQPNSPSLLESFEFQEPECKRDLHH